MGGFFGAIARRDVKDDVFFGVDYHSHLGTRRAGMIIHDETDGFQRQIHSIDNTPFRTKFEKDLIKFHGNMGQSGCVSFMFEEKGVIYVADDEDTEIDEDALMDAALEAGASDVLSEEVGCFEVYTEPADLEAVRDALKDAGFPIQSAELEKVPSSYTALTDEEDIKMMELLLEKLEDDDDVQNVWHNWENN